MVKTELKDYFPIFGKLTQSEQKLLTDNMLLRKAKAGTVLHNGSLDCVGLYIIREGQLRAYISSEEGKTVTLYRLFERDICLMSAPCIMKNLQFDITIEAEKDSEFWIIPADVYKKLMESSIEVANFTNKLMASRFSEVMWLIEQIMWKSFDNRLASFLISESALEESDTLRITHEKIAAHMGTAREVVTRMLSYFQSEGMVTLSRGVITLSDRKRLERLSE